MLMGRNKQTNSWMDVPTQRAGGIPTHSRYCITTSPAVKQQYLGHTSPMAFLRLRDRMTNRAQEWRRA